jgi:predicted kinase
MVDAFALRLTIGNEKMPKLTVLVGPPGSGKSTLARKLCWFGEKQNHATYINQDSQGKEHMAMFEEAIASGKNVLIDRMNFNKEQRSRYLAPAKAAGYETEIKILHESQETCLRRMQDRKDHETIHNESGAKGALKTFFTKYERPTDDEADIVTRIFPDGKKPMAIVCDLDGTLCDISARLHHVRDGKRNWKAFFEEIPTDTVNKWCADLLKHLSIDYPIVFCSGRSQEYEKTTVEWLNRGNVPLPGGHGSWLFMRPTGDYRQDSIIKEVLLDFEILTRFEPFYFIDDRQQVVDKYRSRGYTVLQCAKGSF